MDHPLDGLRYARRRVNGSLESLAQGVAERVIDLLLHAVDINALLREVAVNDLLGRVDVNAILDRVDVNRLLERVDVDRLLERVDVGAVVNRVDVNAIVGRVDMDSLVEQTDLGAVIAKSSGGVANEALDVVRSQAVGLDTFTARWVGKVWRHKHPAPPGPPRLLQEPAEP